MTGIAQRLLYRAFGTPEGVLGRVGGVVMARGNADTEDHVVRDAGLAGTDRVLVLGPGPGLGLAAAARYADVVTGVEPSAAMRTVAQRRCAREIATGRVRLRAGTAAATGLADDAVDVVLSVNNVQLWGPRAAALGELVRVLRPGGRLVVSVHERFAPEGFAGAGFADAVRAAGFTDVRAASWEPDTPAAPGRWLRARLPGTPLPGTPLPRAVPG